MKKIRIVTVYNSLNPGSFLQATSLYLALKKLGYDPSFLKTGARSLFKQAVLGAIFSLKKRQVRAACSQVKSARLFNSMLKSFNVEKNFDRNNDLFVLGSDEIWNVSRRDIVKYPVFWGRGLPLKRCISYAPSLNNATERDLLQYPFVKETLSDLHRISVRDTYSQEILSKISGREVAIVCDPTVLLTKEEFKKNESNCPYSNFILVYIYNKTISREEIEAIRNFAFQKGKKLISFGTVNTWCDINVKGSPRDFLTYIDHADYVCTSTFHGTMLSTIYQKKFAVLGRKNRKVGELLDTLQLDRYANETTLAQVLDHPYDFDKVELCLNNLRESGLSYLKNSLESIN